MIKMRIAYIIPALVNKGPILVVKNIIENLSLENIANITVFYFDKNPELEITNVNKIQISPKDKIDFDAYDIIHTHGIRPGKYIYNNKKNIKAACIATTHSIIFDEYKSNYNVVVAFFIERLWIKFLKRHDVVVTLTKKMQDYYQKLMPKQTIKLIYNGRSIVDEPIDIADEKNIEDFRSNHKIILGTVCAISKLKGLHQVINALKQLPDFGFIIVGDGSEKKALIDLAESLGVSKQCLFLGNRSKGYRYFSVFDIYVLSSYIEGFPLALLEAGIYGMATMCSSITVFRELFTEKEVSYFELDNVSSFLTSVQYAVSHKNELGFNLKQKCESQFSVQNMANKYLTLYQEAYKRLA